MSNLLHITSGDLAGDKLIQSGVPGEVFVWHDILYDGPRNPGWPTARTLADRANFLDGVTGGGMGRDKIQGTLHDQYRKLEQAADYTEVVLWFDACLFDQAMLAHLLACLQGQPGAAVSLVCIDSYPEIVLYHGLGQLPPAYLAATFPERRTVTREQYDYAERTDRAFALQNLALLRAVADEPEPSLPWLPAAIRRWLQEQPDGADGLGLLERLALTAIQAGCRTPTEIFTAVAANDTPPQYWSDITLWAKINGLANREPPLVTITGPATLLPQWDCHGKLDGFRIVPADDGSPPASPSRSYETP